MNSNESSEESEESENENDTLTSNDLKSINHNIKSLGNDDDIFIIS